MYLKMRNLFKRSLPFILIIPLVYYYSKRVLSVLSNETPPVPVTVSPSRYTIVEMNDRVPSFKLATIDGQKPYADGDRAQATIVDSLQLASKCQQDPSLIVVDVGGFLGSYIFDI